MHNKFLMKSFLSNLNKFKPKYLWNLEYELSNSKFFFYSIKKNFATLNEDIKKENFNKQNLNLLENQKSSDNPQFKDNRIIIYTRKINFDENGMFLLYKSEFTLQGYFKSILIKKDMYLSTIIFISTGIIFNFKLALLFLIPLYLKFRKTLNISENLALIRILYANVIITEIYIEKTLKKFIFRCNDSGLVVRDIEENFLLNKEMALFSIDFLKKTNSAIYKLLVYNFIPIKNQRELLLFPLDGLIYDKELLAHVLKGRTIITPEIPNIPDVQVAEESIESDESVFMTKEFKEYVKE